MTVNDILEKIEKLDEIRSSLKDIYHECHELTSSDSDAIYDAIDEYIDKLKKKEVNWHQNDNGAMHTCCVVDDDTGVNYVVVSTERGNGECSIAITPRLNADGSLYVKE